MPAEYKDPLRGPNERGPERRGGGAAGPLRSSRLGDWPGRWPGYWAPHGASMRRECGVKGTPSQTVSKCNWLNSQMSFIKRNRAIYSAKVVPKKSTVIIFKTKETGEAGNEGSGLDSDSDSSERDLTLNTQQTGKLMVSIRSKKFWRSAKRKGNLLLFCTFAVYVVCYQSIHTFGCFVSKLKTQWFQIIF